MKNGEANSTPRLTTTEESDHVHLIIYPGFKLMEAIGPLSVFTYANRRLAERGDPRRYKVTLAAPQPGVIASETMVPLQAQMARFQP